MLNFDRINFCNLLNLRNLNTCEKISSTELHSYTPSLYYLCSYTPVDPLDAPNRYRVYVTSFTYDGFATFINVTWDDVECADEYVLDIFDIGSITTTETSYESSYNLSARNISGNLSAVGGSALPFFEESLVSSNPGWLHAHYTCTCM